MYKFGIANITAGKAGEWEDWGHSCVICLKPPLLAASKTVEELPALRLGSVSFKATVPPWPRRISCACPGKEQAGTDRVEPMECFDTAKETADSTSVLDVSLQWTAEMITPPFQGTVPLGDHPRHVVSGALVQVAARATGVISQQFPGRKLPPL